MTYGACKVCDRPAPGPLPADAVQRLNAARVQPLTIRVVPKDGSLRIAQVTDCVCPKCHRRYARKPMYAWRAA